MKKLALMLSLGVAFLAVGCGSGGDDAPLPNAQKGDGPSPDGKMQQQKPADTSEAAS